MNTIENLALVVETLETVEVHGSTNMNKMLGCIQMLNEVKRHMEQERAAAKAAPEVTADGNGN